jgi:hypothetical protein
MAFIEELRLNPPHIGNEFAVTEETFYPVWKQGKLMFVEIKCDIPTAVKVK